MVEEGLETREQEHEGGVEVAFPQWSVFVSHEVQKKTVDERKRFLAVPCVFDPLI